MIRKEGFPYTIWLANHLSTVALILGYEVEHAHIAKSLVRLTLRDRVNDDNIVKIRVRRDTPELFSLLIRQFRGFGQPVIIQYNAVVIDSLLEAINEGLTIQVPTGEEYPARIIADAYNSCYKETYPGV